VYPYDIETAEMFFYIYIHSFRTKLTDFLWLQTITSLLL